MTLRRCYLLPLFLLTLTIPAAAADLPGSKDPPGMKRYEGSEISWLSSREVRRVRLISRYTYIAPAGRSATELFRNYKLEFQRPGLLTLYEKADWSTRSLTA